MAMLKGRWKGKHLLLVFRRCSEEGSVFWGGRDDYVWTGIKKCWVRKEGKLRRVEEQEALQLCSLQLQATPNKGEGSETIALDQRLTQGHIRGFLDLLQKEQESIFPLTQRPSSETQLLMHLLTYWRYRTREGHDLAREREKQATEQGFLLCAKDGPNKCCSLHHSSGKAPASSRVIWEFLC